MIWEVEEEVVRSRPQARVVMMGAAAGEVEEVVVQDSRVHSK